MKRLTSSDRKVLKTIGHWTDETIEGHHLISWFSHKAARVSVLVAAPQIGHTQKYIYYYRWIKNVDGHFYPSAEFYDDHQASLRACVGKVKAWEKDSFL